ncbi:MAG: xanthine dehydrogenase family protein molybdopterin-binding subunit [Acidobacteria bacterium]|nr:xanthine dehydrogenase family protein molybdopterin-binding subunit [Acidobacteriota bacterium]
MAQQVTGQAGQPGGALNVVGRRGPNIDAIDRVTGQAKYTADIELPGMLTARILRSPHAHARVVRIDTSKAEALGGVLSVITYRDAPKVMIWGSRQYVLNDRVRFAGEAVAAVAAVDADTAARALKLISVEYEPLPFVLDPEAALAAGAPQLFEDGNLEGQPRVVNRGDIEQGLKESDHVIARTYRCPTMWSGSLEPHAVVAQWENDRVTLWCSTQSPFRVHANMVAQLGLPDSHIRIIASYVGGGFGTKSAPHVDETIAALLARKARRPVSLRYSREEEILDSNTRFEVKMYIRMGVKKDMTLHALDIRAFINQGAYHTRLGGLGNHATHLYNVPHLRTVQNRVHTNVPNTGPTRGVGDPQECFGLDSAIDEIAVEMGWDPMAFRLKNIKRNGDPIPRAAGGAEDGRLVTQALDRCIEAGASRIEWTRRNQAPNTAQAGPIRRGMGMACTERTGGGGLSGAQVKVFLDGSVIVFYSSTDIGTGSRTTLSMIAAEVLGIPLKSFRTVAGDTEAAPWDGGSQGNRTLQGTGRAVEAAARDALRQILAGAAPLLKATPEELELVGGSIRVKTETARTMTLQQVMERRGRSVVGDGSIAQGQQGTDVERTSAAHFVELDVDTETGKVTVIKYVSVHDVGRPINVTIVENQIEGGTIQGLALTRSEEMRFDPRNGRTLNANFLDLMPPTMMDFDPRAIEAVIIPNEGLAGPFGGKGLGENPCHPGMAAVANAIYNATGIRLREVPFTRGAILRALNDQRPAASRTA